MNSIRKLIGSHQTKIAAHELFRLLGQGRLLPGVLPFAELLGFWSMAFQDVTRILAARVEDPALKRVARHHQEEDAGHDAWYLEDLAALGVPAPTLGQVFGRAQEAVRAASYAIVAEALHLEHDGSRIALLLAVEASGHVFFERVGRYLERVGLADRFKYFSRWHLQVEQAHDIFDDQTGKELEAIVLSGPARAEAERAVERGFAAFEAIFDALHAQARAALAAPRPVFA